jgi:hypothetical protein
MEVSSLFIYFLIFCQTVLYQERPFGSVTQGLTICMFGYAFPSSFPGKRKNQEKSRQTVRFLHASPGRHFVLRLSFVLRLKNKKNVMKIMILMPAAALQSMSLQSVSKQPYSSKTEICLKVFFSGKKYNNI